MNAGLPISRLISVGVTLTPPPAQAPNLETLLLLGTSTVIDIVQRIRFYTTLAQVAADFGTSAEEYLSAVLWFEQAPQPTSLAIGRWAKNAAAGQLIGGVVTLANQLIAAWNAVTTGSFTVHVDGGAAVNITGLNFATDANLNAVAARINAALTTAVAGVQVAWVAAQGRFVWTSGTTGTTSNVSFITPEGTGVDISAMLAGTAATGAYRANGIAAETALAAVTLFDNQFADQWYGLVIPDAVTADHEAVAAYVEGATVDHVYGLTTQDPNVLNSADTTNIAYLLQQLKYNKTFTQYSSSNAYAVVSALARIMTTDWDGNNTTISLMYKQEPGIVAENLTQTQIAALESFNCNVFVQYNNNTAIIETGVCASGQFLDTIIGIAWLRSAIQTNLYNALYTSPTKIPQTDAGMSILGTQIAAACQQGVVNGLLAPGTWTSQGFGQIGNGSYLSKGYYIYTPPISSQSSGDRAARKSVPFQVAAKLAGAVDTVNVQISVNP